MKAPSYRKTLLAIVALGALLRIAVYFDSRAHDPLFFTPVLDSGIFLDWAGRIAGGEVLGDRVFFLNPLYAYVLAPVRLVAGSETLLVVRLLQGVLGLTTVLLTAGAVRRLTGPGPALLAAFLAAVYPVLLFYEQLVMIVTLAVFLNALALRLLARFAERRTVGAAFLAGLPLGLSILARPNVVLFALLLPLWFPALAERGRRLRFAVGRSAALLGAAALMVLPVTVRNFVVGKDLVPVTSSMGVNLYQTNNPTAWRGGRMDSDLPFGPTELEEASREIAEAAEGRSLKPSEVSGFWTRRALGEMADAPGPAAAWLVRKLFFFLGDAEFPSSYHYEAQREESAFLRWIPLSFGLLCPFALLGLFRVVWRKRGGLPFVLLFAVYAVGLAIFFPLSHYRAPALPAAFALAGIGLGSLLGAAAGREWRTLATRVAIVLLLALVVRAPLIARSRGARALTGYEDNRGIHALRRGLLLSDQGHLEAAWEWLVRARERGAPPAKCEKGFARIERSRGRPHREAEHLLNALNADPATAMDITHDALRLYRGGLRAKGLRLAEIAAREAPDHFPARVNLGEIYTRENRQAEGLAEYRAAQALGAPIWIVARQSRCLRKLGRPGPALSIVTAALGDHAGDGPLNLEKARCLIALGFPDEEEIRRALRAARAAGMDLPRSLAERLDR